MRTIDAFVAYASDYALVCHRKIEELQMVYDSLLTHGEFDKAQAVELYELDGKLNELKGRRDAASELVGFILRYEEGLRR